MHRYNLERNYKTSLIKNNTYYWKVIPYTVYTGKREREKHRESVFYFEIIWDFQENYE